MSIFVFGSLFSIKQERQKFDAHSVLIEFLKYFTIMCYNYLILKLNLKKKILTLSLMPTL